MLLALMGEINADVTAPVLSLPTGTATGSETASGSVTTDEAGTLYYYASTNASETAATIKASGESQTATVGVNNVTVSGLTAATTYYLHFVQDDDASNESNVVASASFDTQADTSNSGGFWFDYDVVYRQRQREEEDRKRKRLKRQKIKDALEREIALEQQKREEAEARLADLQALTKTVEQQQAEVIQFNERVKVAAERAVIKQSYSAMEALERELATVREEEEFLMMATQILINQ